MLIKNLFSLFGGSHQEGRSDNALPNVIEEKESKVIIPEKFKDDIERPYLRPPERWSLFGRKRSRRIATYGAMWTILWLCESLIYKLPYGVQSGLKRVINDL